MRIDPHVHFRDEAQSYKETIAHGLKLAAEQGVNYVFDMPNTAKLIIREEDVKRRLSIVPKENSDQYFLYIGATSNKDQLEEAIKTIKNYKQVIGIKMFAGKSTGDLQVLEEDSQKEVYNILAKNNFKGVLAVHCEKEEYMKNEFDPKDPHSHARARPNIAEIESIKDQIKFVKETNFKGILHICHVSCKESLKIIKQARKEIKITCGVTPHHIIWTEDKLKQDHGMLYKMNPPLRSKDDVDAIQEALKNDEIDWIETDHAPHAIGEKLHKGYPSGYPSLFLYKDLVEIILPKLGLTKEQIENITYNNIVKTFKLNL